MTNGVSIRYGDVAPEAKENFVATANESEFDTLSQFQRYNLLFPNYGNPCEVYSVLLDGNSELMPIDSEFGIGLVSESISESDGTFDTPIVLTLNSVGQYSSQGLTITCDTYNDIYATDISIKWYRVVEGIATLLDEVDYEPDSAFYFCQNNVENYNRLVITFNAINMPENRLRVRAIDYGYGTVFYGDELRNVKLIQEIDPVTTQISINTADFVLDSKGDIDYSFQTRQPLSIYFNGQLKATTFVKSSKRQARFMWEIKSEDYIGLLDNIPYSGGMYDNELASNIIDDIFEVAKIPYNLDASFNNVTVSGYISYTTCREALMQVAFAIQAVVDTSNSDAVNIKQLDDTIKQTVSVDRIMQGQNFVDSDIVTAVEVACHTYKESEEGFAAYNAKDSGGGQNIFVKFSEPLHDLSMTYGTIVESGTNYAIINSTANGFLRGEKYEHTIEVKRRERSDVGATTIEKVIAVSNATLVSSSNIDNVLEKCYNWLVKTNTTNLRIVEGKHVQYGDHIKYGNEKYGTFMFGAKYPNIITYDQRVEVGDVINAGTEYLGTVTGRIIKETFNLNGGIIIKEAVLK